MGNELKKVKPTVVTITIDGKERQIKFGFSAWAMLEEKYGGMKNFKQIVNDINERPFATIPELVYIGLVDKSGVTKETVLDDYGLYDMPELSKKIEAALYGSVPEADESKKK